MKSRRSLVAHAALPMALCFALVGAQPAAAFDASGQSGAGSSSVTPDDGDLIFDGGFEGENGGTSCETAVALNGDEYYAARTNFSTDWMESFGPLPSPSNDVVYSFVADGNDHLFIVRRYNEPARALARFDGFDDLQRVAIDDGHGIVALVRDENLICKRRWRGTEHERRDE